MNQQQSSNTTKKDIILQLLQSGVLKQKNLNDKISHEEISRLINDIISSSEEDYSNISLHFAAERGNLNAVKYFVEQRADVNANNWHAGTPLHLAVWNGHLDVVKYLIENGASVNLKDSRRNAKGWAPLHDAAHRGYLDIVKCLVKKGADINAQDNYDSITPLHEAALYGHLAVVKELIEKGADINAKNAYGETPLDIARSRGNSQIVEFLSSYQHGNRDCRDVVSGNSWTNNSIVNWVKGLASSTESPGLLTSRGHDNTTVTAVPEINTTVVNNTIMLGILATGLFNKTKHKQPIHENLLSPREQSMRRIDMDMIMRAIQQGEEKFGDPDTKMDEVKISGNKTRNVERNK